MLFCPLCHSALLVQNSMNELQFICHTCDYYHPVVSKIQKTLKFENDTDDQIFGVDEKAEKTEITCQKCGHHEAYYIQMQTRSADEPSTIFYRCVDCGNTWKEG